MVKYIINPTKEVLMWITIMLFIYLAYIFNIITKKIHNYDR